MNGLIHLGYVLIGSSVAAVAITGVTWFLAAALHVVWRYYHTPISKCVICLCDIRAPPACKVCKTTMHIACQHKYEMQLLLCHDSVFPAPCPVCRRQLEPVTVNKRMMRAKGCSSR